MKINFVIVLKEVEAGNVAQIMSNCSEECRVRNQNISISQ